MNTHQIEAGQALLTPAPLFEQPDQLHDSTVSCCIQCGSTDVALIECYETCSQTGYGEEDYWRCYSCGARSEEVDERPAEPTVIIIPPGSPFTPTTEDLLRWSVELAIRERMKRDGEAA